MVGGEGGRQLHDDLTTFVSRTSPVGKRRLIREGGSAAPISNELGPPDSGDGARLTTAWTKTPAWTVPLADTHDRGGIPDEHVCFHLAQEPVEQPAPRPAHRRSTRQTDRKLDDVVKVSAVMIDVIPEPVDIPVPTGLAGATNSTNDTPPLFPWCSIWKGTTQDCIDHLRLRHRAVLSVNASTLGKCFPP